MTDVADLDARELLAAYRARRLSPVEAIDGFAARIESVDDELGAFTELCLDRARAEAVHAERAYRSTGEPGLLQGVPFAAKDIIDTAGVRTSYGSAMFADHIPGTDAVAVARLREAGAILLGKTRTHEFAWGITSVNRQTGTPRNPADSQRIAGGSSGGSAVALASRQVPIALGTDTGGSIRIPATFCGVAGIKPTFGTISCTGVWPLAATLDHTGPMARRVGDLGIVLAALGGAARSDGLAALGGSAGPDVQPSRALRIAVCPDLHLVALADDLQAVFNAAIETLGDALGKVATVTFAGADRIHPTFATIQPAEAVISHGRAGLFPARAAEYGDDVRGRLESGTAIDLEHYSDAWATRLELDRRMTDLFDEVDVIATPITAVAPSRIEAPDDVDHLGRRMALRDCVLPYTVPQDLFGLPACAVPVGADGRGLPVAIQLWGRRGSDAIVLAAAAALEAALT